LETVIVPSAAIEKNWVVFTETVPVPVVAARLKRFGIGQW
jgi:hypothetical protein